MSTKSKNTTSSSSSNSEDVDDSAELRRGPWTLQEDSLLVQHISLHGEGRWNLLSKRAGLRRTGKSCRLRWLNYLKPDVKRGNLSPHEQLSILDLHSKWGNKWSKIAQHLPGRTDNEIKNYWRTRVQRQAKHLKVDANSTAFKDIIRCFWMPRLLQKINNGSSSSSPPAVNYFTPQPPPPLQEVGHDQYSEHSDYSSSINISQLDQLQQYQTITPNFEAINNTGVTDYSSCLKDCYYVDSSFYNMGTVSALPQGLGSQSGDQQVADSYWAGCDFGDNMWSMDEFNY